MSNINKESPALNNSESEMLNNITTGEFEIEQSSRELSDDELEAVSGGFLWVIPALVSYGFAGYGIAKNEVRRQQRRG